MKKLFFVLASALLSLVGCGKSSGGIDDDPQPNTPTITLDNESSRSLTFAAEGGEQKVAFTVSTNWTAAVADAQDWCSVTPASGEKGEQQIIVTAQPNEAKEERSTTVTLVCGSATATITVTQEGADWFDFNDGDDSSRTLHFTAEGGAEEVAFTVSGVWTATVTAEFRDWCSVTPASGDGGDQRLTVTVQPNETTEERTATATLVCGSAMVTITITQDGRVNTDERNKIYYTTSDNSVINFSGTSNNKVVSNTYNDGIGVIICEKPITEIPYSAFEDCSSLTDITLPDGVTSIGEFAFRYCSSLASITLPDGLTSIGVGAFYYCSSLTNITLPDEVTSIADAAFRYCVSLTSITIPAGVKSIGYVAFQNCSSLIHVYCKPIAPPSIANSSTFTSSPTFYVPRSSVETYKKASIWSVYADKIVGYDFE